MTVNLLMDEYFDEKIYINTAAKYSAVHNFNQSVNRVHCVLRLDVNIPSWMEIVDTQPLTKDEREKVENILVYIVADYSLISYVPVYDLALASIECIRKDSLDDLSREIWLSYRQMVRTVQAPTNETVTKETSSLFPKCIYNEIMSEYYLESKGEHDETIKRFSYTSREHNNLVKPEFKIRKKLDQGDFIDEGTFGWVYAYNPPDSKTSGDTVVKVLTETASIFNELNVLLHIKHPNIVELIEYGYAGETVYLMMPRAITNLENKGEKSPEIIKSFLRQITEGLHCLHSYKIIHRDIKPLNILVYAQDRVRLCDFGMSQSINIDRTLDCGVASYWYRPIDLLLDNNRYGTDIDIWSLGCVFYFLVMNDALFQGDSELDVVFRIFAVLGKPQENFVSFLKHHRLDYFQSDNNLQIDLPQLLEKIGDDGVTLWKSMLAYNPKDRTTTTAILSSSFLKM